MVVEVFGKPHRPSEYAVFGSVVVTGYLVGHRNCGACVFQLYRMDININKFSF